MIQNIVSAEFINQSLVLPVKLVLEWRTVVSNSGAFLCFCVIYDSPAFQKQLWPVDSGVSGAEHLCLPDHVLVCPAQHIRLVYVPAEYRLHVLKVFYELADVWRPRSDHNWFVLCPICVRFIWR